MANETWKIFLWNIYSPWSVDILELFRIFLIDHYSLSAGYRYRQVTNAGTAAPNRGIDFNRGLVGLTYVF